MSETYRAEAIIDGGLAAKADGLDYDQARNFAGEYASEVDEAKYAITIIIKPEADRDD